MSSSNAADSFDLKPSAPVSVLSWSLVLAATGG
jgi:hypothetical protein